MESGREPGKFYRDDSVTVLKKCAEKTAVKLWTVGIKTVGHFLDIDAIEDFPIPEKMRFKTMKDFWLQAKENCIESNAPPKIDHWLHPNPYVSKFGDEWEDKIQKSAAFSHDCIITSYIKHMMHESVRVMEGAQHENSWVIYHDALSLMTAKSTKQWMRSQGWLKRWILPSENLYNHLPDVKAAYKQKPIGNFLEYL